MAGMREVLKHFFNIGTLEKPKWVLLGDGITSLTEEFNPESDTKQYINQAWINEKIKVLPTGSKVVSEYVRVNILETPTSDGIYPAVKRKCSYQFNSVGGEAGSELVNSMILGGIGDGEIGRFNVKEGSEAWIPAEEAE